MNYALNIFLGLLAIVTIAVLIVLYYMRKGFRFLRRMATGDVTEEEYQRMANKYYKSGDDDGQTFDDDYFKGTGRQQQSARRQQQQSARRRTTSTVDGVTIVDNRAPREANQKIFSKDEGEYVDFTEN